MDNEKRKARNQIEVHGDVATLTIVRRNGEQVSLKIDAGLAQRVSLHLWRVEARGNVVAGFRDDLIYLADTLLQHSGREKIKHENGDKLDFRVSNLRIGRVPLPKKQPRLNKFGHPGIKWNPNGGGGERARPYQVWIFTGGRGGQRSIGHFPDVESAARAQAAAQARHDLKNPRPKAKKGKKS